MAKSAQRRLAKKTKKAAARRVAAEAKNDAWVKRVARRRKTRELPEDVKRRLDKIQQDQETDRQRWVPAPIHVEEKPKKAARPNPVNGVTSIVSGGLPGSGKRR